MSAPTKLVFFGNEFPNDDLKTLFRGLHRHSKDRRFRQLATFLEESTRVLQNEVAQLPEPLKKLVPHFENLMPLTEVDFRQGPLGAAMESALLTILELGMFIGHYEAEERAWDLSADRTTLAGLSIGLLAAAGVALSTHLAEVVQNGAECVRVSFRLGVYVHDISRKLEAPQADGSLLSWAHVVTGESASDLQEELSRYNTETGTPELLKVFISAADKTSVSVSGPPSRIRAAFRASQRLRYSKSLALPVYDGLCHAAHLYDEETIHRVLHPDGSVIPTSRPVQLALLSSRSGQPFEATTAAELFRAISTELLTGTIFLDNITAGILDRTERCADTTKCQIETYRTSLVFKGLLKALEACFPDRTISTTDLIPWVFQDYGARQPKSCADSKLAIVGMACRMPGGANDLDLFWELLAQGRDTHTTVPADRFDLETHYDPTGETENATRTPFGNFIDHPGLFDAGFFNMSPREAEQTDPMHRLALVTAYEALEMAGVVSGRTPSSNPKRIATFYGQASDDWRELNASQNIGTYAVPGGERAFANGRINYFFKFGGPSFNLDTACSSGLAAVQAACSALWAGEADTVLAGGLNIITDPDNYAGLGNGHFLSRTGQCKVWDQSADGYCRADGVGSVVIKRLEDAEADNDNILAVVLSAATNHSAEAISITHPHAGAQKENYTQVLHQAAVNPLDVSYVELHGTGTQAGDAQEAESVLDVFAPRTHRRRADQPLYLGAVKSNIGHGEAAAGIASLLKVLLMYQKNEIPAHIGIPTVINPAIPTDLEQRQVHLPRSKTAWPRAAGQIRRAIVNSFGAHGGNTTLVLEDAPEKQVTVAREERSTHPVVISAKSKKSLAANLETLLAYLDDKPETDLGDLSYTTCARRMHHSWRVATAVSDIPALQKFLRNAVNNDAVSQIRPIPTEAPPVVFTFTGQGAYYAGLAQGLFQALPSFRAEVRQLDHLSQRLGFPSIVPVILGEVEEGTATAMVTQLSIVIVEIALARLWLLLLGIPAPHAVIGHSLGEYAALAIAGVLSTADALYLVGHRAQLIEEHCTPGSHAMLSVRATMADIERLVGTGPDAPTYELSCQNTHQDTVIGGSIPDLNAIREKLEPEGIKCVNVDVPFAFHTAQMDAVRERLAKAVASVPFKTPSVPVLSPLLGSVVFDGKSINPEYIVRATRESVQFATAIDAAQELGIVNNQTLWVDIGPHPICASFVRSLVPGARIVSSCRRNEDNFATMAKSLCTLHLAGRTPSWAEYFRPDEQAYSLLRLPKYRWNEVNYWIQYLGTWTLDKAHIKNGGSQKRAITDVPSVSSLSTSLIHQVTEETVDKTTATLKAISDIQHPDFLEAVHGHTMNNCGVATSSIWTDMAMTVGEHLYRRLVPGTDNVLMDLCDFEVQHAQVANTNSNTPQPLALEAHLDLPTRHMSLAWYDVDATTNQRAAAPFATGSIKYPADPTGAAWSTEWSRITHLIQGRIDALQHMAAENKASTLSKPLAYALFKNVVDYAPRYRGMDRVVIHDYEAFSDITLTTDRHGTWHTPPHWIDSVSHLAGLVMNGSDASNTRDFFYVTPGCGSCRMTEPLIAGGKYRNYVRMFPMPDEAHMYAGDLYILREDKIIGVVEQLKFRRVPRLLMDRFFSPNKNAAAHAAPAPAPAAAPVVKKQSPTPTPTETVPSQPAKTEQKQVQLQLPNLTSAAPSTASSSSSPSSSGVATPTTEQDAPVADASTVTGVAGKCLELIANETGLGVAELTADATFVQLGVDSLMSLVLSEKLRSEMGLEIKSSLFLECPTVGDLTGWLEQYC